MSWLTRLEELCSAYSSALNGRGMLRPVTDKIDTLAAEIEAAERVAEAADGYLNASWGSAVRDNGLGKLDTALAAYRSLKERGR
jgi:hypothetical protein